MHLAIPAGPRRRTRRALLAAALPAVLAATALPAAADASSGAFLLGPDLSVFATTTVAESNSIVIEDLPDARLRVSDPRGVVAGSGCVQSGTSAAICNRPNRINVSAGSGDDAASIRTGIPSVYSGDAGNDVYFGGANAQVTSQVEFIGGNGIDTASYAGASSAVTVTKNDAGNDGRPGRADRDNIRSDVERVMGSPFNDTITGGPGNDIINGVSGNDTLNGGDANDLFEALAGFDGDDTINGGFGIDRVRYAERTVPMAVSLSLTGGNAGGVGTGEDDVLSAIEVAEGGQGNDELRTTSLGAHLLGRGGNDTLLGDTGPDLLNGGSGSDTMHGEGGNDQLIADDLQADSVVECGGGIDSARADAGDNPSGCENVTIGRLALSPRTLNAKAGKPVTVRLSWRVPKSGRRLRTIELRLTRDGVPVGEVTIRPRGERIAADGAIELVRRKSRLTRRGRTVEARLAVRFDESLAGQTLKAEVEATDVRGAHQLERGAGTVRVAG